jgi:hypothetical protein
MYARTNVIYHLATSQGGVWNKYGDGVFPAQNNAIYGLNMDGSAQTITVTVDAGTYLAYFNSKQMTGMNQISGLSVRSGAGDYTSRNNAITQARDALDTVGNPNFAHIAAAGNGSIGYYLNWSGPTGWKTSIENNTGAFVFASDYGVSGPVAVPALVSRVVTVTATPKTITAVESVILIDATAGNRQLFLGLAAASGIARSFNVCIRRIDTSGNTVTVTTSGSNTLNGGTSETLAVGQGKVYVSNGVDAWYSF